MTQVFTKNDVLRYVYNELTEDQNKQIEEAFMQSDEMLSYYLDCIDLKLAMNTLVLEPSDAAVQNILNFARSSAVA